MSPGSFRAEAEVRNQNQKHYLNPALHNGEHYSVVLVTDDRKEDWWLKFKGKTIGPRPELAKEFKDRAQSTFHMYQADRFLELARENLDEEVSEEIVEEVREVRRREKTAYKRMKEREMTEKQTFEMNHLMKELSEIRHCVVTHEQRMHILQKHLSELESQRNELSHRRDYLMNRERSDSELEPFTNHQAALSEECANTRDSLEMSSMECQKLKHRMMALESEIAHRMKIIEQDNSADS